MVLSLTIHSVCLTIMGRLNEAIKVMETVDARKKVNGTTKNESEEKRSNTKTS